MDKGHTFEILDHGYVKLVDWMGDDSSLIEAARMSTGKGFFGWYWTKTTYADVICDNCQTQHLEETLPDMDDTKVCTNCWEPDILPLDNEVPKLMGKKGEPRDLSLLEFLMMNRHATPFEMGEICIEVQAPMVVFREWHRHRTQSYNEFSARYSQMMNLHYLPKLDRFEPKKSSNKQESSSSDGSVSVKQLEEYREDLKLEQQRIYNQYELMLESGVPKEIARLNTPVSRYSKMRAKTDLRNWLFFLGLRMEKSAQWEIRQFANAVALIVRDLFPKSFQLWAEHEFFGVRFSRTEMRALREIIHNHSGIIEGFESGNEILSHHFLTSKKRQLFTKKLTENREELYSDVPAFRGLWEDND